jgi:hypothetical protein
MIMIVTIATIITIKNNNNNNYNNNNKNDNRAGSAMTKPCDARHKPATLRPAFHTTPRAAHRCVLRSGVLDGAGVRVAFLGAAAGHRLVPTGAPMGAEVGLRVYHRDGLR